LSSSETRASPRLEPQVASRFWFKKDGEEETCMDVMERLREVLALMQENDLAEIEIEEQDARIKIRKNQPANYLPPGYHNPQLQNQSPQQLALQGAQPQQQQEAAGALQEGEDDLAEVTSPMVGTFYRSSSPGADAYVSVGSVVEPDTVVCIVEAMKVMNEIKAGVSGEIVEILVEDAEPVEFGQVLFLVEPHEE